MTKAAPILTQIRRPKLSATYEAGMKVRKAPRENAAIIKPVALELSPSK